MTAAYPPWAFAPADLKHIIDLEFVSGINRPVIHTSIHSPVDGKEPGLSLAIFGQYFNRTRHGPRWRDHGVDYFARTSFVLQQGRSVTISPGSAAKTRRSPRNISTASPPAFRPATALISSMPTCSRTCCRCRAATSSRRAGYRLLFLGGSSDQMTLPTLRRIAALAEAGATIVGQRTTSSPSLADDPATYSALAARLWSGSSVTAVGKGCVIATRNIATGLGAASIAPDVDFGASTADFRFLHRKLADDDAYFFDNRENRPEMIEANFRVAGKAPELWHADTGAKNEPLSCLSPPGNPGVEDGRFAALR